MTQPSHAAYAAARDVLIAEIADMKKERDELLEALRGIVETHDERRPGWVTDLALAVTHARTAIARAESKVQ